MEKRIAMTNHVDSHGDLSQVSILSLGFLFPVRTLNKYAFHR